MVFLKGFFVFTALLLFSTSVVASDFEKPQIEYSADTLMTSVEGMEIPGKVYYTPDKERREIEMAGRKTILITRDDLGKHWVLMTNNMTYMEQTPGAHDDPTDLDKKDDVKFTALGKETVNGISTTKNKMVVTNSDGTTFTGFIWLTGDNIMVKFKSTPGPGSREGSVTMELSNLKLGSQSASLFEIPEGYKKFAMPNMGGMPGMTGGPGGPGGGAPPSKEEMKRMMEEMQRRMQR